MTDIPVGLDALIEVQLGVAALTLIAAMGGRHTLSDMFLVIVILGDLALVLLCGLTIKAYWGDCI